MRKIFMIALVLFICFLPVTAFAAAPQEVSSSDLIDHTKEYNGLEVSIIGEVIGDILNRGEYTWLNISDGSNAIGIWAKTSDLEGIHIIGRYTSHGDTVRITGIFNRACAQHGGDLDIHAQTIEIIENGFATEHAFPYIKAILACLLFAAAIICITFVLKKHLKYV